MIRRAPARRLLSPGAHVAPFLSHDGRLVLVAIEGEGILSGLGEVTAVNGGCTIEIAGHRFSEPAAWTLMPSIARQAPCIDARQMLGRGVHLAPWREPGPDSMTLLAVDSRHRLLGQMVVRNQLDESATRRELSAILNAFDPERPEMSVL